MVPDAPGRDRGTQLEIRDGSKTVVERISGRVGQNSPGSERGQLLRPGGTTQASTWDSRINKAADHKDGTGSGVRDVGR